MSLYAEVALSVPVDSTFIYIIPEGEAPFALVGSRVLVPFGPRVLTGVITGIQKKIDDSSLRLKEIKELLDHRPLFSPTFLGFTREIADYYHCSWGKILIGSLPPSFTPQSKSVIQLTDEGRESLRSGILSPREKEAAEILREKGYSDIYLRRKLKVSNISSLLSRMEKKGLVTIRTGVHKAPIRKKKSSSVIPKQLEIDFSLDNHALKTAKTIAGCISEECFAPFLLFGPRNIREGLYSLLIRETLAAGKKILVLVPEIAQTLHLLAALEKRLGERAAILHSRLSPVQWEREWQKIREQAVDVVIGPRSALFAPLNDTGLIIVDEEQDESYFQQESPTYDARKGAWFRAFSEPCPLVYGSDYPSVETVYKARKENWLIDLGRSPKRLSFQLVQAGRSYAVLSNEVFQAIRRTVEKKGQALIFVNRRGYAEAVYCPSCSYVPRCFSCDIPLTYHKKERQLQCRYCDFKEPQVRVCPSCGKKLALKREFGIEVIEEQVKKRFPDMKLACFYTDEVRTRKERSRVLSLFLNRQIDVLIGTQLLAHQKDLHKVDLVVVLHPEALLSLADFRAGQKAYQNLNRMTGFLDEDKGDFIVQTDIPGHVSIQAAASRDYASFYDSEIKYRRMMNYPPFTVMAEVILQAGDLRILARKAREFVDRVRKEKNDVEVLGPAKAQVPRIRGRNRIQIILKSQKKKELDAVIDKGLSGLRVRKSLLIYG